MFRTFVAIGSSSEFQGIVKLQTKMMFPESSMEKVKITLNFFCTDSSSCNKMDIAAGYFPTTSIFLFYTDGLGNGYRSLRVEMKVINSRLFNKDNSDFYLIKGRCFFTSNYANL